MSDVMTTTTRQWTVTDLEELPEDDTNRYEIIDGELYVTTAPHVWHQVIVWRVGTAIELWDQQTGAGQMVLGPGVILSPTDAVIPDVVWVGRDRFSAMLGEDGKLHAAPELVVEVLSPGGANEKRDRETKLRFYGDWGVQEYWIVDRFTRMVEVYRLVEDALQPAERLDEEDELSSPLLPGFSYRVVLLFADIPS